MNKGRYNPYPWYLDEGQIRDADGWSLGSVPYTLGGPDDHENGRLMAAAPELLEALETLVKRCTEALNRVDPGNAGLWHALTQEARELLERLENPG